MFNLQPRSEENTNTKAQTVQTTTDYARFRYLNGNRDLKEPNIKAIQNQLQQFGQRIPILVNERNEVIDGQHRLEACKRLGIPVKFIVDIGATIDHVISANIVGQKWSLMDYVNRYSSEGNRNYQLLHDFIIECKKHGISASAAMNIVSSGKSYKGYHMYEDGKIRQHGGHYKIKKLYYVGDDVKLGYFRLESLKQPRKRLEAIVQFKHFPFYKKSFFINALLQVMRIKDFDVKRLRQAADTYPNRFVNEPDVEGFVRMFESVYNYRTKNKLPLVNHPERTK
jgi:hypothetical protein